MFFMTLLSSDERSKLERLYIRYERLMFKIAYLILENVMQAEDAVHEAALRAARHLHKIDENDEAASRCYLCEICKNVAYDMLKSRKRMTPGSDIVEISADERDFCNPENIIVNDANLAIAIKAVNSLEHKYRTVFMLRYVSHLDRATIADVCGITLENVKKRLVRAKIMINERLVKEGISK